jgi:hypothetical protein
VITLAIILKFTVTPVYNQQYYNPMTKTIEDDHYDIDLSLAAFTELHHPGYSYAYSFIENTGIGKYAMTMSQYNLFAGKEEFMSASLDRNKLTMPNDFLAGNLSINIFARASYPVYNLDSESETKYLNK